MSERRPPVWIGHIGPITVRDLDRSLPFYAALGCRPVGRFGNAAILELRGGTHLILREGVPQPGSAPFDLMVADLHAFHRELSAHALPVSPIRPGHIHASFTVRDPDGWVIPINDSHVMGPV